MNISLFVAAMILLAIGGVLVTGEVMVVAAMILMFVNIG